MKKDVAIYVASGGDIVGDRLLSVLRDRGYSNLLNGKTPQPDALDSRNLAEYFGDAQPEYVFLTAGKSGGIQANQETPADLMLDNLQVACNV
ncbi:uncharacterized protein METZ01_LOCUS433401, partial [marine metagenome]